MSYSFRQSTAGNDNEYNSATLHRYIIMKQTSYAMERADNKESTTLYVISNSLSVCDLDSFIC